MSDTISTGSPVWIVYPQKRHLSARVQAFIGWISELFERTSKPQCRIAAAAAGNAGKAAIRNEELVSDARAA